MSDASGLRASGVRIETERLVMTLPPPKDAPLAMDFCMRNRAHLAPWEPVRADDYFQEPHWTQQLTLNRAGFDDDRSARFFLRLADAPERLVGTCNLSAFVRGPFQACFLGYSLDGALQGRGLMSEALTAVVEFAFDTLRLHRIQANYVPENERSGRVLERLGFLREGLAKDYLLIDGSWRDHVLTSRTNTTWTPRAEHAQLLRPVLAADGSDDPGRAR